MPNNIQSYSHSYLAEFGKKSTKSIARNSAIFLSTQIMLPAYALAMGISAVAYMPLALASTVFSLNVDYRNYFHFCSLESISFAFGSLLYTPASLLCCLWFCDTIDRLYLAEDEPNVYK